MKVYGHPLSSCTRKVLITLAEKGQRAEFFPVDLFTAEHKATAHMARHPFGVVPVLDDDGFVLYESRAIVRYLDARFPAPCLTPTSLKDAARMDQWLSVDASYIAPHTRALAVERLVKKHEGKEADPAVVRASEGALGAALAVLDRELTTREYLAGDTFSLADISLMPYVASLPMIGAQHLVTGLTSLGAWWSRVETRPSWRAATGS
jgi:glutathione S-transferase